jgi:hypothetical protein
MILNLKIKIKKKRKCQKEN